MRRDFLSSAGILSGAAAVERRTDSLTAQVLVYGGTVAGIGAALAAARMGCQPVLIERGEHFGGMAASGLGGIDTLRDNAFGASFANSSTGSANTIFKPMEEIQSNIA